MKPIFKTFIKPRSVKFQTKGNSLPFKLCLIVLLALVAGKGWGQTTVFSDNFNSGTSDTWTTSGALGSWTVTTSGADWGASRATTNTRCELTNDASATDNVEGYVYLNTLTSSFLSPYNTTLSSNPGLVTWSFNLRQIRTDPAGFGAGSYGVAFVLASSGTDINSTGIADGYAVVLGQTLSDDRLRLVSFTDGLDGFTDLITGANDFGTNYLSVKVTYAPSTNTWELFYRDDAGTFADPLSGSLTSQGTAVNSTYTSSALNYMGFYWQGSTAATQIAFSDNVVVSVVSGNSTSSDIIRHTTFTEPTNIAYASYQSSNIIADANDIEVAKFTIRDGGASSDADALSTTLTAITFSVSNVANLRRIALYDGTTEISEIAAASPASFSSFTLDPATDNGSKDFSIRVSFLSAVTDKQQFQFTVTSATADGAGSTFAAADAGAAASSTTGDANRIEVTATQLGYVQQPSNTNINVAMSPAVTIEAKDANNNRDLDFTSNIRITSTGTLTGTPVDVAASSGLATFSTLTHTASGTGFTLNAERTSTLDWDITSSTFDITDVPVTIVNWDFPNNPDDAIADGGIAANSTKTISSSGTSAILYSYSGATTNSARATGWDAGNGTKYWQIEFVTTNYNTLKFSSKQRSSATGPRDFKAQYKVGAGGTWTDITGATSITVADNYSSGVLSEVALPTECDNQSSVYIRWIMTSNTSVDLGTVASAGASNIDDIIIIGIYYSCSVPTTQASAITFTNVASASMTVNWVRGGTPGEGVIVLAKSGSAVDSDPVDGTTYTASSTFGSGTQLGTGNYVVFMGSGTSVNITGLSPGTTYYFKVYEYNCTGADSKFNVTSPPSNSQATTSCSTPTTQASNITFSSVGSSQMTVNWTNGNGEKRIVIINTINSFTNPVNGTDPSGNSVYGGSGEQVVYNNSGNSITITGLTSSTTYWFRVYEAKCTGSNILFFTDAATNNPNSQTTITETYSACGTEGFANGTTAPNGWTFTAIGGTYTTAGNYGAASPSLQFDATGDQVVTANVTLPGQLSFWIKGNGTDANCYFKVEGYNGSWVQIENINPIPTSGTTKTYGSVSTYTKFRFTYTKNNGNVAFDDVQVNCGGCTITSFPYTEDFDGVNEPNLPCGWTMTNDNSDDKQWKTSSGYPHSGTNSMYIKKNTTVIMDDWFFTPKLVGLTAGTTYNISFYYRNSISSKTEKLEVKWGPTASAAGMTGGTIYTNASISNESYYQATGSFSPGSSGDYYIGFHGYSDANQSELYIDDISIISCSGVPSAPVEQAATNIGAVYFTANWSSVPTATKYYLDVSTVSNFATFVAGYNNKDVGNVTSYVVSGLNLNTTYYYQVRAYNSCGTSGNSGTINLTTLATSSTTILDYGDLAILAVNANLGSGGSACVSGSNNGDEISFLCFKDITNGTEIQITDNGYERCNAGKWGNTEGGAKLTRTGGTIPAGTVITFRTDMNAGHEIIFVSPDASWAVSHLDATGAKSTSFNMNAGGDQIYFAQSGVWTNNTTNGHDAVYPGSSGKILYGFSTNGTWTASCSTNPTQNSNLYTGMSCLCMAPTGSTDWNKYTGPLTEATQREWLDRINDNSNWTNYASCASFQSDGPQYDNGMTLTILQGGFSKGTWNGAVGSDWFSCSNWQSMYVPDATINVLIPSSGVINEPTIGAAGAKCNNLNIKVDRTLTINNAASTLDIYGNYDNGGTLTHSNGVVTFIGAVSQIISGFSATTFYNLTINNSSSTGITISVNDVTVSNTLTLTDGELILNEKTLIIQNSATGAITGGSASSYIVSEHLAATNNSKVQWNIGSITDNHVFPFGYNGNYLPVTFNNGGDATGNITASTRHTVADDNQPWATGVTSMSGTGTNLSSAIDRWWDVTSSVASPTPAVTLSLSYIGAENTMTDPADRTTELGVQHWGTGWDDGKGGAGGTVSLSGTNGVTSGVETITVTGQTYFSPRVIVKGSKPLPIELFNFTADCNNDMVYLNWFTASETNNDYFTVNRSQDNSNWEILTTVDGA
ncbi:MAG: fibronectin type III domain-containing protein, partial [Bacteroidia bacterium]|nr:fibronectin type III domain-containing protein [Bacteroidia bacterium]